MLQIYFCPIKNWFSFKGIHLLQHYYPQFTKLHTFQSNNIILPSVTKYYSNGIVDHCVVHDNVIKTQFCTLNGSLLWLLLLKIRIIMISRHFVFCYINKTWKIRANNLPLAVAAHNTEVTVITGYIITRLSFKSNF